MQQVLSFSLPLPSRPAAPKLERKHLDGTIAALPMKLKQSLTWWSVHWSSESGVFSLLKKEKGGVGEWDVNLKEGMQPNPYHSSVKVPKLTSCTSEKQPMLWKTQHYA